VNDKFFTLMNGREMKRHGNICSCRSEWGWLKEPVPDCTHCQEPREIERDFNMEVYVVDHRPQHLTQEPEVPELAGRTTHVYLCQRCTEESYVPCRDCNSPIYIALSPPRNDDGQYRCVSCNTHYENRKYEVEEKIVEENEISVIRGSEAGRWGITPSAQTTHGGSRTARFPTFTARRQEQITVEPAPTIDEVTVTTNTDGDYVYTRSMDGHTTTVSGATGLPIEPDQPQAPLPTIEHEGWEVHVVDETDATIEVATAADANQATEEAINSIWDDGACPVPEPPDEPQEEQGLIMSATEIVRRRELMREIMELDVREIEQDITPPGVDRGE